MLPDKQLRRHHQDQSLQRPNSEDITPFQFAYSEPCCRQTMNLLDQLSVPLFQNWTGMQPTWAGVPPYDKPADTNSLAKQPWQGRTATQPQSDQLFRNNMLALCQWCLLAFVLVDASPDRYPCKLHRVVCECCFFQSHARTMMFERHGYVCSKPDQTRHGASATQIFMSFSCFSVYLEFGCSQHKW